MKLILILIYMFSGFGMVDLDVTDQPEIAPISEPILATVTSEKIGEFVVCGEVGDKEDGAIVSSSSCDGLSNCGGANDEYCGSVDYRNPDGSGHTVVCRGYDGPPGDPIVE